MNDTATKIALYVGAATGVIIAIQTLLARMRGVLDESDNLIIRAMMSGRRVAQEKRDAEITGLTDRLDSLDRFVKKLQGQVNSLQYDLADSRGYSWRAFDEIQRLHPETTFPKPPDIRGFAPDPPGDGHA